LGRQERLLDPNGGRLEAFAYDLRQLRQAAGGPSYRQLSRRAGYSVSVLWTAARGLDLPTLPVLLAYVGACGGDCVVWERRWRNLAAELAAGRDAARPPADVPGTSPRPPSGTVPQQLPLDVYPFLGRGAELAELDRLMLESGRGVRLAVASGTAGVGEPKPGS